MTFKDVSYSWRKTHKSGTPTVEYPTSETTIYIDLLQPKDPVSVSHWQGNLYWIFIRYNCRGISDSMLMKLSAELPPHCIVFLEDVDAARVGRRDNADAEQESNSGSRVTLFGLLYVLDGVSSQEGRVLIMTTNHIEQLDEALIRPGRTDKMVHLEACR
jgi:hypothetical protein